MLSFLDTAPFAPASLISRLLLLVTRALSCEGGRFGEGLWRGLSGKRGVLRPLEDRIDKSAIA